MQIINKFYKLLNVYIYFILFSLLIVFFSTTYSNANTFKVSNVEISSPFELNFEKNSVIDKGFQTSFSDLISMITTSGDRKKIKNVSIKELLKVFWECHDPTQGMRQGNDKGTQYRSVIYCSSNEDLEISLKSKIQYQETLQANGYGDITTEIVLSPKYFLAEEYHQQYLAKNPNGYCGLGGTGCAIDI